MADTDVQSNDVDTLRPAAGDGGATGDTSGDKDKSNPDGGRETKPRPSPVDVAAAQNAGQDGGIKTPTTSGQTPRSAAGPSRNDTFRDRERKIGHRRIDEGGVVTYKKIGSNQLMASIQLGIQQAVGSLASKPDLDVLIQDFYVVETIFFPNSGSQSTPAHQFTDFRFKVYAPIAFRHFRDLFRIQPDDYLVSLCTEPLRELSNPGASGSIFYLTNDDEFIIKTVQHKEAEFLQKLLPGYYMNLRQNPRTLLPKFFGLYNYQCNAKNIRLIVMNNILPSSIKMHQRYDLKGSTYKRKANKYERSKDSPTFKDLDFMEHHPEGILLEAETHKALINTIARDCRVLTSFKIMDYSLLVGIHNLDLAAKKKAQEKERRLNGGGEGGSKAGGGGGRGGDGGGGGGGGGGLGSSGVEGAGGEDAGGEGAEGASLTRSRSINRHKLVAHSTAMESIQADSDPIDEEDQVPPGGIPARNVKGERLLLFLGIIDILQSFRLKKKLEHTFKSMIHDGDTISVHRPTFYAQRFLKFMENTVFKKIPSPLRHSPSRRRGASLRVMRPMSQTDPEHPSEPHEGQEGSGGRLTGGLTAITSTATSTAATTTATSSPAVTVTPGAAAAAAAAGGGGPVAAGLGTGTPSTPVNLPAVLQDRPHSGRGRVPPPVPPRSPRGGGATQAAPVTSSFSISRGGVAYLTMPPSPRYPGGSPRFSHLCSPSIGMTGYNIWHVDSMHKLERECMNSAVHAHGKGRQHYVWQLPTEDVMRLQLSDVSPEVSPHLSSRRSSAENALHAVREAWGAIRTASRPTSPITPPHSANKESTPSQHHSLSHHFKPSCLDRQTSDDKKNQQFVLPDTHITSTSNSPYSQTLIRKDVSAPISFHESDKYISGITENKLIRSSPGRRQPQGEGVCTVYTNLSDCDLKKAPQSISASHVSRSDCESQLLKNATSENQPYGRRTWDESRMQASYPELERARQLEYMSPHTRQSYAGVEGIRTQYCDPKRNSMTGSSPTVEEQYINHALGHHYGKSRSPSPRIEYMSQSPYRRPGSPYQYRGKHSPYIPSQTPSPRSQPLGTQMSAISDVTLYQNSPSKDERHPSAPYVTSHSVGGDLSQLYTDHSEKQHSPSPAEGPTFFLSEI